MAWASAPTDLEYNDDEKLDRILRQHGQPLSDSPDYPPHLQMTMLCADLETLGCEGGNPGDECRFAAMGTVTSTFVGREDCRIELEITQMAGEDGKFFDLTQPAHVCLCGPELEKMDLDTDCERGDMIHLIGRARLEHISDTEYGGQVGCLQVIALTFEDESQESREG